MFNPSSKNMPDPITLNCVPVAATEFQTLIYEEFIMRCNKDTDYIGTAISYFVHPMIALPQLGTIGNISEKDLAQSGKLMFIKEFINLLKIALNTKSLDVAFVCSNPVSELVLKQMIKGRGYKTKDLASNGFSENACGLVVSTTGSGKKDKQNSGQEGPISLIMVIDSGILVEDVISGRNIGRNLHSRKTVYLNCIDTPEMKLHNYCAIKPRSLSPFDYLNKPSKEEFEALFKTSSRRSSPERVSLWNNMVAHDIVRWTVECPQVKDYRFNFCNSSRDMIEFYFNFKTSPIVLSKAHERLASAMLAAYKKAHPANSDPSSSKSNPTDPRTSSNAKSIHSNTRPPAPSTKSAPRKVAESTHSGVRGGRSRVFEFPNHKTSTSSGKRHDSSALNDYKEPLKERKDTYSNRNDTKRLKTEPIEETPSVPIVPSVMKDQTRETHLRDPRIRNYHEKVSEDNPPNQISNQPPKTMEVQQTGTVGSLGAPSSQPLAEPKGISTVTPSSVLSLSENNIKDDYSSALEQALKKFQSDIQNMLK